MIPIVMTKTGQGPIGRGTTWDGNPCECGDVSGLLKCEHGHENYITYHCDNQVCPECSDRWMQDLLDECQMRMSWMWKQHPTHAYHIMLSFDEPTTKEDYQHDRQEAIKWLKILGQDGGNIVPHGRRWEEDLHLHFHVFSLGTWLVPDKEYLDKHKAVWRIGPDGKEEIIIRYGRIVIKLLSSKNTASWDLEEYELDHAVKVEYCEKVKKKDWLNKCYYEVDEWRSLHTVSWWGCFNSRYVKRNETSEAVQATCRVKVQKMGPWVAGKPDMLGPYDCGAYVYEQRVIYVQGVEQINPPHLKYTRTVSFEWRREPPWRNGNVQKM